MVGGGNGIVRINSGMLVSTELGNFYLIDVDSLKATKLKCELQEPLKSLQNFGQNSVCM